MEVQVLVSCMYEDVAGLLKRMNIQTSTIVVNQCDTDCIEEVIMEGPQKNQCKVLIVNTTERGLSRSRNMAIKYSWGDICYLCDDDEQLQEDFKKTVIEAYETHADKDVITFAVNRKNYTYPTSEGKVSLSQLLRTSSVQTTFKRSSIVNNNISFDVLMGSGSGNGGGEENKFLMDCRRNGLSIYYIPKVISTVLSENSQWFNGFTEKYFIDTGWSVRRILGTPLAFLYIFYWAFVRSRHFKVEYSKLRILQLLYSGFKEKR